MPGNEEAKRNLQRALRQALAKLPADQQHLLAVRFAEGCSLEETAQATGSDPDVVKSLQLRALDSLRSRLVEG
jgi:RNA polymerase sigma factor (sigma-70 family)